MDLAISKYDKRGSSMINRCRLYLQVISIFDLLIFGKSDVHPLYLEGEIPPSRTSLILWPQHPRPPKHFWKLTPILLKMPIDWGHVTKYRYSPFFYKHRHLHHLYQLVDGQLTHFPLCSCRRSRPRIFYKRIPYQCDLHT
jgi:hypothetical protein